MRNSFITKPFSVRFWAPISVGMLSFAAIEQIMNGI